MHDIALELAKFSDIIYRDEPHTYHIGEKRLTSVTTLMHRYETFDKMEVSARTALKRGVTQQSLLDEWAYEGLVASVKGTAVHAYIENRLACKLFPYPADIVARDFLRKTLSRKNGRHVSECSRISGPSPRAN